MHPSVSSENDSADWADSARRWARQQGIGKRRYAERQPLILSGHGMRLHINNGALEIQNGFTHYPQIRETWRFFPGDQERPARIILLDGSGALTLDVLAWLAAQDIPLIQLDYRGNVLAAIGQRSIGNDPGLLALQVAAAHDPKRAGAIATWLVREKLIAARQTLLAALSDSTARKAALALVNAEIDRLSQPFAGPKTALLGIEGKCAQLYFDTWRDLPITWKSTTRKPIPETWRRIGPRRSRAQARSRNATHPAQAMLNYAYAVLESQIRIETARIGLDPATGFLHDQRPDRPALILDLLEPLRPTVDRIVLGVIAGQTFTPADFTLSADGTCRLHPALARRLVADIGPIEGISPLLAAFLRRLGHTPPLAIPHRSKAWLAQKRVAGPAETRQSPV
ncbi:CRISPR-associated endonuclease Cas1 [Acidibrevibacterium fodinaquatile]|uniref:CRISPR-associated endonuclease Cas1 n=1 Tax=Acidibrevibacterium fodinaquatile TaxID=1969806 RepID=UPI0013B3A79F|nr:CRISPR-associated endonuclease Cas1 [Acidibrevibacterium fodinaquatile]